jgi:L-asparaginase/Glu-tRNA(Gln) amidotransferase subunit D
MADAPDTNVCFIVGTLPDGRVLIDFRALPVDHLKLTQAQALDLAEGLVEAVRQARQGIVIFTGTDLHSG